VAPFHFEKTKLIRQSGIPLYYQLKDILREQVLTGVFKEGDILPPEKELKEFYGVSRQVARRALAELVLEGFVVSRKGVGTFVNRLRMIRQLSIMTSFTRNLKSISPDAQTHVIKQDVIPANQKICEAFHLKPEEKVVVVERVGLVEQVVLAVIIAYYPLSIGEIFLNTNLENQSLYDLLFDKRQIVPSKVERIITGMPAPLDLAAILDVRESFPLLCLSGTTFKENNEAFEYSEIYYRTDQVGFYFTSRHE
jgi:GntR family transcriptional regulator